MSGAVVRRFVPDLSFEQIAASGQCFRFEACDGYWIVSAFDRVLKVQQIENLCLFHCSESEFDDIWHDYFDLATDYSEIKRKIVAQNDPFLTEAVKFGWGLRILRQDLWETLVTFLISQRNNIPRIRKTVLALCNGAHFPTPDELKNHSVEDFRRLGLGYRAKYLYELVQKVVNREFDLQALYDKATAMTHLQQLPGVGIKVASCVALFALHHLDAFPVDVWIKRAIDTHYNGSFSLQDSLKDYAGVVQQYMFFYQRSLA